MPLQFLRVPFAGLTANVIHSSLLTSEPSPCTCFRIVPPLTLRGGREGLVFPTRQAHQRKKDLPCGRPFFCTADPCETLRRGPSSPERQTGKSDTKQDQRRRFRHRSFYEVILVADSIARSGIAGAHRDGVAA